MCSNFGMDMELLRLPFFNSPRFRTRNYFGEDASLSLRVSLPDRRVFCFVGP